VPGKTAFFDAHNDNVTGRTVQGTIKNSPRRGVLIHKFVLSPGSNDIDIQEYTRNIMEQLSHSKGLDLQWFAREHTNTDHAHAHVIIMGFDRQGRSVRFDRTDHKLMCKFGDRYIEAHERFYRDLEQDLERAVSTARTREPTTRETAEKFASKASTALKRLFGRGPDEEPRWLRRRRENRFQLRRKWYQCRSERENREIQSLGDTRSAKPHREKPPTKIVWDRPGEDGTSTRVELTANRSLPALAELARAYRAGMCTLSRKDLSLLVSWMEDKLRQLRELDRKAKDIRYIDLKVGTDHVYTISPDSSLKDLRTLWNAHRTGKVVLKEEEAHAIGWWLSKKDRDRHPSR